MRPTVQRENITLGERLAVALLSVIAAGFTVAFIWSVAFLAGAIVTTDYAKTTIFWGVVATLGAGVAGFILGGERAARWFGILWGTQEATEKQLGLALGFIILVCGILVFVALM